MCVKLIDVLSSHSTFISIAIDPDVITYLCSIILPRQMMSAALSLNKKNQIFNNMVTEDQVQASANFAQHTEQSHVFNIPAGGSHYEMMDDIQTPTHTDPPVEPQLEDS